MNEDKSNPNDPTTTNPIPEHPEVVVMRPAHHKKWLIVALLLVLLAGGAAVALFVWPGYLKDKTPPPASPSSNNTGTNNNTAAAPKQYYYYSINNQQASGDMYKHTIVLTDTATGTKTEEEIDTNYPLFVSGLGVNRPIQFEASGKEYVVATSSPDAIDGGVPNTFTLYKGTVGAKPEIVLSGKDQRSITDWLYTLDGKELYYVEQKWDEERKNLVSTELHKLDYQTKKDTVVGTLTRPADRTHSRLFNVGDDNSIRFYSALADGTYETKLDRATAKITSKKVVNVDAYGEAAPMQNGLSPDGTKLLAYSGGSRVTVYLMDLTKGTSKKLLQSSDTRIAYGGGEWAPGGDSIAFNTYPFSGEGQKQAGFKNQLVTVKPDNGEISVLVEDASPGIDASDYTKHMVNVYGWAPDGSHIVYAHNGNLAFYDLAQKKTTYTDSIFKDYFAFDSSAAYGWAKY